MPHHGSATPGRQDDVFAPGECMTGMERHRPGLLDQTRIVRGLPATGLERRHVDSDAERTKETGRVVGGIREESVTQAGNKEGGTHS